MKKYLLNILSWFIITCFIFATSQTNYEAWKDLSVPSLFILYILLGMVIPYYYTRIILVERFYRAVDFKIYFTKIFIIGFLYIIISHVFIRIYFNIIYHTKLFPSIKSVLQSIYILTVNILISSSIAAITKIAWNYFVIKRRLIELEKERISVELELLKSQIQPHYLFNILNTIYFLIEKQNVFARNTVEQFSNILRHLIYGSSDKLIDCNTEIEFVHQYFNIQKLRYSENYNFQFNAEKISNKKIPPHLILPLLENAFKHISNFRNEINKLNIDIYDEGGFYLITKIENTFEAKDNKIGSEGIGINNLRKRLVLLFGDNSLYKTFVDVDKNIYSIILKIPYVA